VLVVDRLIADAHMAALYDLFSCAAAAPTLSSTTFDQNTHKKGL
jgi:hypothetical protein